MNKALLPLLLCCFISPASGKGAGWQWHNEEVNPEEKENKPVSAAPRQEPDVMQELTALRTATKRALYEAILYPDVDNFVKYFRLQNYWAQQARLFTMSAKKAMLTHPELDYNLQYSHCNGVVWNQLVAGRTQQRQAIVKLAEHHGITLFYWGQDPIDGQLAQIISGLRDTYGLSVTPVSVGGVINLLLLDSRTDQGRAQRLGMEYFPAMMLVDPGQGSVRPLSCGLIPQGDLTKQFLNIFEDFKPNFQPKVMYAYRGFVFFCRCRPVYRGGCWLFLYRTE